MLVMGDKNPPMLIGDAYHAECTPSSVKEWIVFVDEEVRVIRHRPVFRRHRGESGGG